MRAVALPEAQQVAVALRVEVQLLHAPLLQPASQWLASQPIGKPARQSVSRLSAN